MEQRPLGGSGLRVPAVGMGTWQTLDVRGAAGEGRSRRIVDAALASGARLFDTSPMYGRAEAVLGKALEGRRDEALIESSAIAGCTARFRPRAVPSACARMRSPAIRRGWTTARGIWSRSWPGGSDG